MAPLGTTGCQDIQRCADDVLADRGPQRLRRPPPCAATDQPTPAGILRHDHHRPGSRGITRGEDLRDCMCTVFLKASGAYLLLRGLGDVGTRAASDAGVTIDRWYWSPPDGLYGLRTLFCTPERRQSTPLDLRRARETSTSALARKKEPPAVVVLCLTTLTLAAQVDYRLP
jgi:hypothetical protein